MTKDQDWEEICDRCGKCCYEKVDLGAGHVVYTDEPCSHLDTTTNLCKVYDRRHELVPDCISLTEKLVRSLHWLPPDCAYVRYVRYMDTLAAVRAFEPNPHSRGRSRRRR